MGMNAKETISMYTGNDEYGQGGSRKGRRRRYNPRFNKQKRAGHVPLGINARGRRRSVGGAAKLGEGL